MARYAVDASVVLARLLYENYVLVNQFWSDIGPSDEIIGAQMLLPECTSVLRESTFASRITPDEAHEALRDLISLPIITSVKLEQFTRALELAERFGKAKAYDMQYLAIAELEAIPLVTIDGGLRQSAIELRHPVRFLR